MAMVPNNVSSATSTTAARPASSSISQKKDLTQAAKDFETFIWGNVLSSMQRSSLKSDLFGDGFQEEMFQTMLMNEFSKSMSDSLGKGSLSDLMLRQLSGTDRVNMRSDAALASGAAANNIKGSDSYASSQATAPTESVLSDIEKCFGTNCISSKYGWRNDPFDGAKRFHQGIDLPMVVGTEVRTPTQGEVVYAGETPDYGKTVVIRSKDGAEFRFAHASEILCKKGDTVSGGNVVCRSGNTGRSVGPHLHFEVWKDGNPLNPLDFFNELKNSSSFAELLP